MNKRFITILIPVLILLAMTVIPLKTLALGEEILLETKPVDPRDIFRGDYVVLSYKIEDIEINKFEDSLRKRLIESSFPYNHDIFVKLKEDNGIYIVDEVVLNKPTDTQVYLKGKYRHLMERSLDDNDSGMIISVSYDIDRYFVPENTGLELEKASQRGELLAKIKVSKGYGILTDVIIK